MSKHTGNIVELRPEASDLYVVATGGWRGVVKDEKIDDDGFEMIYVEWDRDHWLWEAGQPNGWTFPGHFKVVGTVAVEQMIKTAMERIKSEPEPEPEEPDLSELTDDDVCPHCGMEHQDVFLDDDDARAYHDTLFENAVEEARGSEGFLLIWVANERLSDETTTRVPYRISSAMNKDAIDLMQVEVMEVAAEVVGRLFEEKFGGR